IAAGVVRVQTGNIGRQPLFRVSQNSAGPMNVFERYPSFALSCPKDALSPMGVDRFDIGILGDAENQKRPETLPRQRSQLNAGRWFLDFHEESLSHRNAHRYFKLVVYQLPDLLVIVRHASWLRRLLCMQLGEAP